MDDWFNPGSSDVPAANNESPDEGFKINRFPVWYQQMCKDFPLDVRPSNQNTSVMSPNPLETHADLSTIRPDLLSLSPAPTSDPDWSNPFAEHGLKIKPEPMEPALTAPAGPPKFEIHRACSPSPRSPLSNTQSTTSAVATRIMSDTTNSPTAFGLQLGPEMKPFPGVGESAPLFGFSQVKNEAISDCLSYTDEAKEAEEIAIAKERSLAVTANARRLEDDAFLGFGNPNAILMINMPDGTSSIINNIDVNLVANNCGLLALSFEERAFGDAVASLDVESRAVAMCLLRFCYTGEYLDELNDIRRCSLLLHAQLCKLAGDLEVAELQVMAHANIIKETEVSCSEPVAPEDLCKAIRYIFEHLSNQRPLIDTLLHYCVNCFLYHGLGTNEEFRQLAFELAPFNRELARCNFHRNFVDDGAAEIVRLPVREPKPHSSFDSKAALGGFLFDLHGLDDVESLVKTKEERSKNKMGESSDSFSDLDSDRKIPAKRRFGQQQPFALVQRPKGASSDTEESADEGFTLVHRPKVYKSQEASEKMVHADHSSSDADDSADDVEDQKPAKQAKIKTEYEEDLESSFATIKPIHIAKETATADKSNCEVGFQTDVSDSEWSLV